MPPRKAVNQKKDNILKRNPNDFRQQVRSPELLQEEAEDDEREIEGNTRLGELLKTIKRLSGNWWEIDLAKILDEYVDIISKVQVKIDGVETTIDFSKASYVIQNMTNAYSKKVELLLELVEKFREDLRVYNTGGNLEGNTNADGRHKRNRKAVQRLGINAEDFDLDFLREVGKHTSSKNLRRLDPREARQNARSFPFITLPPWYLTNQNTSSATESDAPGANKTPLMSLSGDMVGYMEDFRVNRPFDSSTGFVGYNFNEDNEDIDVPEVNPLILPTQGFTQESVSFHLPVDGDGSPNLLESLNSFCDLPNPPDLESDREDECLTPVREIRTLQPRDPNAADNAKKEKKPSQTPQKPKFDSWSRIDLYTVKLEDKPAKSGKTTLLPDGLKVNNGRNTSISSSVNGHSKVRDVIKLITAPTRNNNLSVKMARMLIPEFVIESMTKVSELGQLVKKMKKEIPPQLPEEGEEDDDIDDHYYEGRDDVYSNGLTDDSFSLEPEIPLDNQDNLLSYQLEGLMTALQKSQLNATLADDESISYMQLAQQRVAEYMAQAHEYLQKTDLAKRVADWHEAILPHLEESEKRPNFDIHEYGTFVLNKLSENLEKEWLHFGEVVQGKPAAEVGRFFSATLQLANSLNIDIRDDGHLAIDTMHVKFLKSERHHECMDEGEAFQQQKKNGKRKIT